MREPLNDRMHLRSQRRRWAIVLAVLQVGVVRSGRGAEGGAAWEVGAPVAVDPSVDPGAGGGDPCERVGALEEVMLSATTKDAGEVMRGATVALRGSRSCSSAARLRHDITALLINIIPEVLAAVHAGDVGWICRDVVAVLGSYVEEDHVDGERAQRNIAAIRELQARLAREAICAKEASPEPAPPGPVEGSGRSSAAGRRMRDAGIVLLSVGGAGLVGGVVLSGLVVQTEHDRLEVNVQTREDDPPLWDRGWSLWRAQVGVYAVAGSLAVTGAVLLAIGIRQMRRHAAWRAVPGIGPGGVSLRIHF